MFLLEATTKGWMKTGCVTSRHPGGRLRQHKSSANSRRQPFLLLTSVATCLFLGILEPGWTSIMSQGEVVRLPNPLQDFLSQVGSLSKEEDNLVIVYCWYKLSSGGKVWGVSGPGQLTVTILLLTSLSNCKQQSNIHEKKETPLCMHCIYAPTVWETASSWTQLASAPRPMSIVQGVGG